MKLKLKNVGKKISRIGHVGRHVVFGARIEVFLASWNGRRYTLVFLTKLPPSFIILFWRDLTGKHFPAPLVDQQSERQERNLLQRCLQQKTNVFRGIRSLVQQTQLHEILWSDRQSDCISDSLVETIVSAVAEQHRLAVVGALIEVVSQFVVDRTEIFCRNVNAHLDSEVIDVIEVPG